MKHIPPAIYDQIDRYLTGSLTAEEERLFEEKTAANTQLAKVVDQYRTLVEGIRYSARKENLERLKSIEKELPEINPESRFYIGRYKRLLAVAAGIALVVAVGLALTKVYLSPTSASELYASYYHPYPNIVDAIKRGDSEDVQASVEQGYQLYEQRKYKKAIEAFSRPAPENASTAALFYKGSAHLAADEPEQAIAAFKMVVQRNEDFNVQAQWYMGLAYLKLNETKQAKEVFERLAQEDNSYNNLSRSILKKID